MGTAPQGGLGRGLGALIPTTRTGPQPRPWVGSEEMPDADMSDGGSQAPGDMAAHALANQAIPALSRGDIPAQPSTPDADGAGLNAVAGASFAEIPVAAIVANRKQPRQHFDDEAMAELRASIDAFGLLQPIVVRRSDPTHFEMVMGERRWRAARELGLERIPAIVRTTADDAMLRDALLENLHRQALNPLEEAAAYQQLLEEFGATHDELAGRIGRSRSQVSNTLRLLNLPIAVQRRVAAGVLSAGHARALLALDDPDAEDELAGRIVAEGLSVRATEEIVATGPTRRRRRSVPTRRTASVQLTELADRLSDRLDTTVSVEMGKHKGKLVIQFASAADLERIIGLVDQAAASNPAAGSATEILRPLFGEASRVNASATDSPDLEQAASALRSADGDPE